MYKAKVEQLWRNKINGAVAKSSEIGIKHCNCNTALHFTSLNKQAHHIFASALWVLLQPARKNISEAFDAIVFGGMPFHVLRMFFDRRAMKPTSPARVREDLPNSGAK